MDLTHNVQIEVDDHMLEELELFLRLELPHEVIQLALRQELDPLLEDEGLNEVQELLDDPFFLELLVDRPEEERELVGRGQEIDDD